MILRRAALAALLYAPIAGQVLRLRDEFRGVRVPIRR